MFYNFIFFCKFIFFLLFRFFLLILSYIFFKIRNLNLDGYFSRFLISLKFCFTIKNNSSFFLISNLLLLPDESTYYLFSIFYDFYFFCYLFLFDFLINFALYLYFGFLIFFISSFKFLFFGEFFCIYFFYIVFILFLFLDFLILFVFIFCLNIIIYFFDKIFRTPFAGLILFSKDFLAIEDEDLWISSNIFYLDSKIIQSDSMSIPLKVQDIDVFFTLVTLFFDTPKTNIDYFQYTLDLNNLKKDRDTKKYFRKSRNRSVFNFAKELDKLRSKQHLNKSDLSNSGGDNSIQLFKFYKKFFKSVGLSFESLHLKRKKRLLISKRFKTRNLHLLNSRSSIKVKSQRLESAISAVPQNENLLNDLVLLKVLRSSKTFNNRREVPLIKSNIKEFRGNSRFLNFFWFSFPFYLYHANYFISFLNSLIVGQSFFIKRIYYKCFYFFYSLGYWANNPSSYIRQTFFNYKDFSVLDRKQSDFSFSKLLDSYLFILLGDKSSDKEKEAQLDVDNEKVNNLSKNNPDSVGDKKSKKQKQLDKSKKKRKTKRDYKRFLRKPFTSEYVRANSKKNFTFVNEYDLVFYKKYPDLRVLDLYKVLEYFYFVITNDLDFYESVTFAAKVAVLRDKYGQTIVSDLLSKEDHKQAAKVSVQMHYTASTLPYFDDSKEDGLDINDDIKESEHIKEVNVSNVMDVEREKAAIKKKFRFKTTQMSSDISIFSKNLLLSYRYRFKF